MSCGRHHATTSSPALTITVREGTGMYAGAFAFHLNHEVSEVSTNHRTVNLENLTRRVMEFTEKVSGLVTDLLYLDGVKGVDFDRYSVTIYCGTAFTYENIADTVIDRLMTHVGWDGDAEVTRSSGLYS